MGTQKREDEPDRKGDWRLEDHLQPEEQDGGR